MGILPMVAPNSLQMALLSVTEILKTPKMTRLLHIKHRANTMHSIAPFPRAESKVPPPRIFGSRMIFPWLGITVFIGISDFPMIFLTTVFCKRILIRERVL